MKEVLEKTARSLQGAGNVLPSLETVEVEPAQELIREIFIAHITHAKGLDKAAGFVGGPIIPTPRASLQAAALLADGAEGEQGIGSLLVVEVGGATTNIHSVMEQSLVTPQTVLLGLPESRVKRTVEGDWAFGTIRPPSTDFVGRTRSAETCVSSTGRWMSRRSIPTRTSTTSPGRGHTPTEARARRRIGGGPPPSIAVTSRPARSNRSSRDGREILVQRGKNLLDAEHVIGTGGIFRYGLHPERVLQAALFSPETPWSLKPRAPKTFIDRDYMLYGIGLLATNHPVQALRIAKRYLKPSEINS